MFFLLTLKNRRYVKLFLSPVFPEAAPKGDTPYAY